MRYKNGKKEFHMSDYALLIVAATVAVVVLVTTGHDAAAVSAVAGVLLKHATMK